MNSSPRPIIPPAPKVHANDLPAWLLLLKFTRNTVSTMPDHAFEAMVSRRRILGVESSELLETKDSRKFPVEFDGVSLNYNTFEIILPTGYEVDDLPPPVDVDYGFASYHSKTEASGNMLRYTRSFKVKEVTVPLSKVENLKKLYRIIASDERNTAVLKPVTH